MPSHIICGRGVSLQSEGRIVAFTTGTPHTNTVVCTALIESENDLIPVADQSRRVRHHSKRRHRWVGVIGSARNGCRKTRCPPTRRHEMVREGTGSVLKVLPMSGQGPMRQFAPRVREVLCDDL
ncbi:hypothetical protein TNCV_2915901 [Trichonephila clavipes]|nr:hypothetical protein TNCV_2915901 [Trichonephila clavipes]